MAPNHTPRPRGDAARIIQTLTRDRAGTVIAVTAVTVGLVISVISVGCALAGNMVGAENGTIVVMFMAMMGLPMWAGYGLAHRKTARAVHTSHIGDLEDRIAELTDTMNNLATSLDAATRANNVRPLDLGRR